MLLTCVCVQTVLGFEISEAVVTKVPRGVNVSFHMFLHITLFQSVDVSKCQTSKTSIRLFYIHRFSLLFNIFTRTPHLTNAIAIPLGHPSLLIGFVLPILPIVLIAVILIAHHLVICRGQGQGLAGSWVVGGGVHLLYWLGSPWSQT